MMAALMKNAVIFYMTWYELVKKIEVTGSPKVGALRLMVLVLNQIMTWYLCYFAAKLREETKQNKTKQKKQHK